MQETERTGRQVFPGPLARQGVCGHRSRRVVLRIGLPGIVGKVGLRDRVGPRTPPLCFQLSQQRGSVSAEKLGCFTGDKMSA